jgi:plastocyanin
MSRGVILAAAPSKVPFYIAGGVLVVWAVLVAAYGITHVDFPGAKGRARLVMLTTFVLVVATMAAAVLTAGEPEPKAEAAPAAPAPAPSGRTLSLAADPSGALKFDKTSASVQSGQVTVDFKNPSTLDHNVTIAQGSKTLGATDTVSKSDAKASVNLSPGTYVYFCSVPGHRQAGMQGTLTVK